MGTAARAATRVISADTEEQRSSTAQTEPTRLSLDAFQSSRAQSQPTSEGYE